MDFTLETLSVTNRVASCGESHLATLVTSTSFTRQLYVTGCVASWQNGWLVINWP